MSGSTEGSGFQGRSRHRPRKDYRAENDAQAHAGPCDPQASPPHPQAPSGAAQLVTNSQQLSELLTHLRAAKSFAYDSEFIGELTYIPKLCLIQVGTIQQVTLIDPLADFDLHPFWELLADPSIEKIVHAGQQDIEPVFRHLGKPAANLFDCQIAAGFVGFGYPLSLSKLVSAVIGVRLSKGLTFTHWDRRPLSNHQLHYAADDVRYLPAVRAELGRRLAALGYGDWVAEESNALADPALYRFDPESQYLKIRGSATLHPRNLAILRELCTWRDFAAREEDVPSRSLIKDEILLDIARNPVSTVDDLRHVRGLPRPVESQRGQAIVDAVRRAQALANDDLPSPKSHEPAPREKFCADALWATAQCLCTGRQLDPNVITSRQEIGELHRAQTAGESLEPLRLMRGWRRAALGQILLEVMEGRVSFAARWDKDCLSTEVRGV